MDANLIYVDAPDRFLDLLAGVDEPERKRKIIGGGFIRGFDEEARKPPGTSFRIRLVIVFSTGQASSGTVALMASTGGRSAGGFGL